MPPTRTRRHGRTLQRAHRRGDCGAGERTVQQQAAMCGQVWTTLVQPGRARGLLPGRPGDSGRDRTLRRLRHADVELHAERLCGGRRWQPGNATGGGAQQHAGHAVQRAGATRQAVGGTATGGASVDDSVDDSVDFVNNAHDVIFAAGRSPRPSPLPSTTTASPNRRDFSTCSSSTRCRGSSGS